MVKNFHPEYVWETIPVLKNHIVTKDVMFMVISAVGYTNGSSDVYFGTKYIQYPLFNSKLHGVVIGETGYGNYGNTYSDYYYGKHHGKEIIYFADEKTIYEFNLFVNNKKHGDCIINHENGNKKHVNRFVNNIREGVSEIWDRDGKLHVITTYKNSQKHGFHQVYYRNGKLKREGNYENGLKSGEWKLYFPNGKLNVINRYKSGHCMYSTFIK